MVRRRVGPGTGSGHGRQVRGRSVRARSSIGLTVRLTRATCRVVAYGLVAYGLVARSPVSSIVMTLAVEVRRVSINHSVICSGRVRGGMADSMVVSGMVAGRERTGWRRRRRSICSRHQLLIAVRVAGPAKQHRRRRQALHWHGHCHGPEHTGAKNAVHGVSLTTARHSHRPQGRTLSAAPLDATEPIHDAGWRGGPSAPTFCDSHLRMRSASPMREYLPAESSKTMMSLRPASCACMTTQRPASAM